MAGFATLLHQSAVLFTILKYLGTAYLFYLAYELYHSNQSIELQECKNQKPYSRLVLDGIILNLLNPKLTLFFMLFLPPFIDPNSAHLRLDMMILVMVFMAQTLIIYAIYAAFATIIRKRLFKNSRAMAYMNKSFAAILFFFGIRLALEKNSA